MRLQQHGESNGCSACNGYTHGSGTQLRVTYFNFSVPWFPHRQNTVNMCKALRTVIVNKVNHNHHHHSSCMKVTIALSRTYRCSKNVSPFSSFCPPPLFLKGTPTGYLWDARFFWRMFLTSTILIYIDSKAAICFFPSKYPFSEERSRARRKPTPYF